jgi:hypothetical protein
VRAFWTDAEGIFETARDASLAGSPDCDLAILIGPQGEIHMLEAAGWALAGLLAEYGGKTAYRVTRERGQVWLEGRSGGDTCLLRSESPAVAARHLLAFHASPVPAPAFQLPRPELLTEGSGGNTCHPMVKS